MPPKYFYAKNGDAVEQLERIMANQEKPSSSGPDAFLTDFLNSASYSSIYLYSRHLRRARIDHQPVVAEVAHDGQGGVAKLLRRPLLCLQLLSRIARHRPDRVLCGSSGSRLWMCYIGALLTGATLVHSRHNRVSVDPTGSPFRRLSQTLDQMVIRRCHAVVCHGPYLVDELLAAGISKKRIVEFDVEFSDFAAHEAGTDRPAVLDQLGGKRVILFVGRVETKKGVLDLLEAFEALQSEQEDLALVLAGSGGSIEHLRQRVIQQGLEDRVFVLGRVPHEQLPELLRNSAVIATPTKPGFPEGRCMVVMEAYVYGKPVIAPNYGPFPYLVKHQSNGLLFEPGNADDLRQKLSELFSNAGLLAKLQSAAAVTGAELITPPMTFSEAVELAFTDPESRLASND